MQHDMFLAAAAMHTKAETLTDLHLSELASEYPALSFIFEAMREMIHDREEAEEEHKKEIEETKEDLEREVSNLEDDLQDVRGELAGAESMLEALQDEVRAFLASENYADEVALQRLRDALDD